MIKIENVEVMGWEHAIRGMRNPMNSWEKSDSGICKGGTMVSDVRTVQIRNIAPTHLIVPGSLVKQTTI